MMLNDGEHNGQRVELVINHDGEGEYNISLINVFKNMGDCSRIFVCLICLCLILGGAGSMSLSWLNRDRGTAQSTLTVDYRQSVEVESEDEMTGTLIKEVREIGPDQVDFNAYILNTAIGKAGLSNVLAADSVSSNITIVRNLTPQSSQALEVLQESIKSGKAATTELMNINLEYSDNYLISIKNGFGKDGSKPVYLTTSQLNLLLDSILESYNEYLYKTKADTALPQKFADKDQILSMDYLKGLDVLRADLEDYKKYCMEKAEKYPEYRSPSSGLGFADIAGLIDVNKEASVDYLYSYVYGNSIAKDPESLIASLNYELKTKTLELDRLDSLIAADEKLVQEYKNDQVIVAFSEENSLQESLINTDFYNNLFTELYQMYDKRSECNAKIEQLKDCIAKFSGAAFKASDDLDEEMKDVLAKTSEIGSFVYEYAKEFVSGDSIKSSFTRYSSAICQTKSLFSSSNIKQAIIAGAAAAFLMVCVWAVYAFVEEVKKEEARHEVLK